MAVICAASVVTRFRRVDYTFTVGAKPYFYTIIMYMIPCLTDEF